MYSHHSILYAFPYVPCFSLTQLPFTVFPFALTLFFTPLFFFRAFFIWLLFLVFYNFLLCGFSAFTSLPLFIIFHSHLAPGVGCHICLEFSGVATVALFCLHVFVFLGIRRGARQHSWLISPRRSFWHNTLLWSIIPVNSRGLPPVISTRLPESFAWCVTLVRISYIQRKASCVLVIFASCPRLRCSIILLIFFESACVRADVGCSAVGGSSYLRPGLLSLPSDLLACCERSFVKVCLYIRLGVFLALGGSDSFVSDNLHAEWTRVLAMLILYWMYTLYAHPGWSRMV